MEVRAGWSIYSLRRRNLQIIYAQVASYSDFASLALSTVIRTAATLLRALPLLRLCLLHYHHFRFTTESNNTSALCNTAESTPTDKNSPSLGLNTTGLSTKEPKDPGLDDPDCRKWKEKEAEILEDIDGGGGGRLDCADLDLYISGSARLVAE
ncbi:protein DCL-like protein [Forsythia ovata]|uniref:Protein DCL-like protein n=1 Tax=Forsythia ovata TaxID=205694 RepID=A0ABD1UZF6_9LAMI